MSEPKERERRMSCPRSHKSCPEESRLQDRFCHLMRKTSSNSLAFWRRKGMSGRIFTDEEREAAKHYRREARQRLADKAYYSRV
jgi:hypothetical protein